MGDLDSVEGWEYGRTGSVAFGSGVGGTVWHDLRDDSLTGSSVFVLTGAGVEGEGEGGMSAEFSR